MTELSIDASNSYNVRFAHTYTLSYLGTASKCVNKKVNISYGRGCSFLTSESIRA